MLLSCMIFGDGTDVACGCGDDFSTASPEANDPEGGPEKGKGL